MKLRTKVGIYVRVSTQEQIDGYSLQEQEDRLRKYAEINDWIVHRVYSDPGFSGAKMERPGLQSMISDIKRGRIQKVLVYKLDRLSRRQRDTLYLIEDVFNEHNVDFVSITEQLDTGSPVGRAFIGILATFAQLEREQIRERMEMGMVARAKEGYFHGGIYHPIGYDYIDGELEVNEYEAMQVRKIHDLFLGGMSIHGIANYLNEKGYTKKYKKTWDTNSVRSVLFSEVYTGVIKWRGEKYKGRHTPLVTQEEFEKVQREQERRIENSPQHRASMFKRTAILGGLIWCGNCGARYYTKCNTVKRHKSTDPNKEPIRYYTCYSRGKSSKKQIKDPNCKNPSFNREKLDELILNEVRKLAVDEKYLTRLLEESEGTDLADDIKVLTDRVDDIDLQINKLIDLYQLGTIDFNMINEKVQKLNDEKASLEYEIDSLGSPPPPLDIDAINDNLKTIPDILDSGIVEDIKSVVHSLINSIIIYDDAIEINWNFQ